MTPPKVFPQYVTSDMAVVGIMFDSGTYYYNVPPYVWNDLKNTRVSIGRKLKVIKANVRCRKDGSCIKSNELSEIELIQNRRDRDEVVRKWKVNAGFIDPITGKDL